MRKRLYLLVGLVVVTAIMAIIGFLFTSGPANASLAMTELQVQKLTCGSCVENITTALSKLDGVDTVDVNLTTGRSRVTFAPDRVSPATIAATISAAGYPAEIEQELTAEQYRALQQEAARLSELYVAKIGDRLLSRKEFNAAIDQQLPLAGNTAQPELRPQLIARVWPMVQQRLMLLEAAARNQVIVQDGEVDLQIRAMRKQQPDLDSVIQSRYGSAENFTRQIKEQMIIQRNITDHVLAGETVPQKRRALFEGWLEDLPGTIDVIIYDPQLKQLTRSAAGGCSGGNGSCCS